MVDLSISEGVWLFYDGKCPICSSVADYLRIKKQYGSLNLVDARDPLNYELVRSVNEQGFDLDEGVVIVHDGRFLHGQAALRFMAEHSAVRNFFNLVCKGVFWSENVSRLVYPWLRSCRNWLLRRRQIERIDNLKLCEEPIFQSVFGETWKEVALVIRRRYANRPYTDDKIIVEGTLNISCAGPIRFLAPLFWLLRTVPPINEKSVPVSVDFDSNRHTKELHFNRVFQFRNRRPYILRSRMSQVKANEIVEILNCGICWLGTCSWREGKVVMEHKGYALKLLGHSVPLPKPYAGMLTPLVARFMACQGDCPITGGVLRLSPSLTDCLRKWGISTYGEVGFQARSQYVSYCSAQREHAKRKREIYQAEQDLRLINNGGWDNYPRSYKRYQMYRWTMWGASALAVFALFNLIVKLPARQWIKQKSQADEGECYEQAWWELNNGNIQAGIWARLLANNKGDEEKTRAAYLTERVNQLIAARQAAQWVEKSKPPKSTTAEEGKLPFTLPSDTKIYVCRAIAIIGLPIFFYFGITDHQCTLRGRHVVTRWQCLGRRHV